MTDHDENGIQNQRTGKIGMGLGLALGVALGAAMGNIALGLAAGIILGGVSVAITRYRQRK